MIRAAIVDDEHHIRAGLSEKLVKYCPEIELVGEAKSVEEAFEMILEKRPELLFLDVEMPPSSGFELLKRLPKLDIEIVFITAFDSYAKNAIKFSALDFLSKPIATSELVEAVGKAKIKIREKTSESYNRELLRNLQTPYSAENRVGIPTEEGIEFIPTGDIIRCRGNGSYTEIFLKSGEAITSSYHLKEFEKLLGDYHFFRIHRTHLVNIDHVEKYIKGEGGYVKLMDGSTADVSRRKKIAFLDFLRLYRRIL